ncbi:MAG: HAD family hydrolase [Angelakisella sp.]
MPFGASGRASPQTGPHPRPGTYPRLEARPVAYVGDSQVDISLGKNLGLPTVLMTWGSRTPAELLAADPSAILADTAAQLEARLEQYLADLQ